MAVVAKRRSPTALFLLAAAALAFDADPRLPWIAGVAGAVFFGSAATVRELQARRELRHRRATADRLILQAPRHAGTSELTAWRARELTAAPAREELRREIEQLLRALSPDRLPSASPLNRPAARHNSDLLLVLAGRLGDGNPVAARGVLLTRALLREAGSPLYNEQAGELLPRALSRALGALEP
jgi:hypothetical protein